MSDRQTGVVKWFNEQKGFGFIKPDKAGKDLFVHKNQTNGHDLPDGVKVSFIVTQGAKGPGANDINILD